MKNKIVFLILIILVFVCFSEKSYSMERKRIAILNITANNLKNSYADAVRDILEVNLYKTNSFDILERKEIGVILREKKYKKNQDIDIDSAIKIGKLLNVDTVVIGSITKLKKYTIIIKFVDINKGYVEFADKEIVDKEDKIEEAINNLTKRAARSAQLFPYSYYLRGAVPGWAQIYSGNKTKGKLFLSSFILSSTILVVTIYDYRKKKNNYDDLSATSTEFDKNHKKDEMDSAKRRRNITGLIFTALYIANWVDVLYFNKYVSVESNGLKAKTSNNHFFNVNFIQKSNICIETKYEASIGYRF